MSPEKVLVSVTVQPPAWKRLAAWVAVVLLVLFSTISGSRATPAAEVEVFGVDFGGLLLTGRLELTGLDLLGVGVALGVLDVLTEFVPVAFAACRPLG